MTHLSWISLIPPVLVVILAIKTKSIVFSLFSGVTASLLLIFFGGPEPPEGSGPIDMIIYGLNILSDSVGSKDNILLIIFLCLMGGIIAVLTASGCANSFSDTVTKRVKTKRKAEGITFLIGCLIFIDDYFNAITVGNMMVSITDKMKISRAKLAYLIDSTSAPVTVLMPVSSWVATIISLMLPELKANGFNMRGMHAFMGAMAYNLYAWLTLFMVVIVIFFNMNIGKMKLFEERFAETGRDESVFVDVNETVIDNIAEDNKGTTSDMIAVLLFLVVSTIALMLYTGGIMDNNITVTAAFINCNPNISLAVSAVMTIIVCFVIFVAIRKMKLSKFEDAFLHGVKSMSAPIIILILSWTFSSLLGGQGLRTGEFLALIFNKVLPGYTLPMLVFVIAALISFSTGASWGAMAITIPTSITICMAIDPTYINMVLGATMAGSVFGDHCSPLADTTVMSSSGAGCKHLEHVVTQLPYAIIVAVISMAGYLFAGLSHRGWVAYAFGICAIMAIGIIYNRFADNSEKGRNAGGQHVQNSSM